MAFALGKRGPVPKLHLFWAIDGEKSYRADVGYIEMAPKIGDPVPKNQDVFFWYWKRDIFRIPLLLVSFFSEGNAFSSMQKLYTV